VNETVVRSLSARRKGIILVSCCLSLLIVSMEDLLGVPDQVNVPGTVDSYPNWRRRLPVTLEGLARMEGIKTITEGMRAAGRSLSTGL